MLKGPEAYGFRGDVWTKQRIADVIYRELGARYHRGHICRLLAEVGWTVQKPEKRATQRDEEKIKARSETRYPALKKKARAENRLIVFLDESAFCLLPGVVRTWAPKGQTPLLRSRLTRDHLSAISAVTPEGDLFIQVREDSFKGPDVVRFLKHLLSHLGFRLLVIWDGGPIHRARVVKDYLASTNGIQVGQLPAYAPELNPDEGIWRHPFVFG